MKLGFEGDSESSSTCERLPANHRAAKSIGPVDVDYGDDNSCESTGVLKHLISDYLEEKFAR